VVSRATGFQSLDVRDSRFLMGLRAFHCPFDYPLLTGTGEVLPFALGQVTSVGIGSEADARKSQLVAVNLRFDSSERTCRGQPLADGRR
jgi:hypothetical protein